MTVRWIMTETNILNPLQNRKSLGVYLSGPALRADVIKEYLIKAEKGGYSKVDFYYENLGSQVKFSILL